ncbi:MAG: NAD(P)/FAD-dependent oxidoreductase [Bacteroidetes bacterium]|nr:NAD(P)/FAD-dependent oxidoreductase [Bacteroidota bacterium]
MNSKKEVLIIGGGTAGIMVAAKLRKEHKDVSVTLIEPADTHYYQPAWTLVGAGTFDFQKTARPMKDLIPQGVKWVMDKAVGFDPKNNLVKTESNGDLSYDYLVVATGLVMEPSMIEGLQEGLEKGVVCSNYTDPKHTWEVLRNFKGGNAVFTQPTTPIKCGGAPQKIAYLAADYFRKKGIADKSNVIFATPGTVIFGVKPIRDTLMDVVNRYHIHFKPSYSPYRVDVQNKIIHFKHTAVGENRCVINEDNDLGESMVGDTDISMPFDMLHIAPPQAAPKFIRESVLADGNGWLSVNHNTLQHNKYPNIFGLGDVADLPTAKTGAAIRKQVPVVVNNIATMMKINSLGQKEYNGYSSCPLVTGYGKMVLAEFDYAGNFTPDPKLKRMFVFNSDKEHWRLWMLKKYGLPYLYWNKMLKGIDV